MQGKLSLCALLFLCACYENPTAAELLVGTWSGESSFGESTMTFHADGTYTSVLEGTFIDSSESGEFEVEGVTLRLRGTRDNVNEFSTERFFAIDADTLVLDVLSAQGKVKGVEGTWLGRSRYIGIGHGQSFETGHDRRLTIGPHGQAELYEASFEGQAASELTMTGSYALGDGGKLDVELVYEFEGFDGPSSVVTSLAFIVVNERALSFEPTFGVLARVE
jgi:hypothetical protein